MAVKNERQRGLLMRITCRMIRLIYLTQKDAESFPVTKPLLLAYFRLHYRINYAENLESL